MINSSTFSFLKDLKKNNDRDWFAANKHRYDASKINVVEFVNALLQEISKTHPEFKNIEPSKAVMRIYRDVRFSKDKKPYKLNFGINLNPMGKGIEGPGYYLHIQPNESFIGGGWWMPNADKLKNIRQEIDYNSKEFNAILNDKKFKKIYGALSEEDKLLTTPKGYAKDHPDIELLRLKSFTAFSAIPDADFSNKKILTQISSAIDALKPLIAFLEKAM